MKKIFAVLLLAVLLCGCASAGPASQVGTPSEPTDAPTQQDTNVTIPTATVPKNPGLTVNPYDPENKVPEQTKDKIRQDYCDHNVNVTIDQVRLRFMGVFGEAYVMFVDVKDMMYAEVINTENVAGFQFVYRCSQHMQVWHDGSFYSLRLAYDAGLLTVEDLRQLSLDYYGANPDLWQHIAADE